MEKILCIEGMSCRHCVGRVKKYLETVATDVRVDIDTKRAVFTPGPDLDMETVIKEITAFGFTAKES